ncbi:MAG: hypothetical protein ACOC44_15560 [Promethearchaeia archaeon]
MQQQAVINFEPTSKKKKWIDYYQKAYQNTRIYYQHGRVNGRKAVRLFFDGEIIDTRYKTSKYRDCQFDIQAYGGQDMNAAQMQREECLQIIVRHLFEKLGFTIEIEPQLDRYTPDVLATKGDLQIYIELKAYHRHNIVGDPEITQTMKYFEMANRIHENGENHNSKYPPRAILFTTGDLIRKRDSYLSHPQKKPYRHVKRFYKKRIAPRKYVDSMDKFTSKMMYIHAHKKFKKNRKMGFRKMDVHFPEDLREQYFPDFILQPSKYDVLLLDAEILYGMLKREDLRQEAHYFRLIRQARLEKLVLNKNILEMS